MADSGGQHKSKIKACPERGRRMQKVKPQCKNQKFSLSAHKAEISGEMHCSLCAFVPLCLCTSVPLCFAPLFLSALRSKNKKQSQFAGW